MTLPPSIVHSPPTVGVARAIAAARNINKAGGEGLEIADLMPICQCHPPISRRIFALSKPELGIQRLRGNCGAKFYDLNKNPIACPTCTTVFVVPTPVTRKVPAAAARMRPQPFLGGAGGRVEEAATSVVPPAEFEQAKSEAETSEEEIGIGESRDDAILIDADE